MLLISIVEDVLNHLMCQNGIALSTSKECCETVASSCIEKYKMTPKSGTTESPIGGGRDEANKCILNGLSKFSREYTM